LAKKVFNRMFGKNLHFSVGNRTDNLPALQFAEAWPQVAVRFEAAKLSVAPKAMQEVCT
jgi:hypothetical protein